MLSKRCATPILAATLLAAEQRDDRRLGKGLCHLLGDSLRPAVGLHEIVRDDDSDAPIRHGDYPTRLDRGFVLRRAVPKAPEAGAQDGPSLNVGFEDTHTDRQRR